MPSLSRFCWLMHYYTVVANVGYDQYQRWDVFDGGETDCSALTIHCLDEAGFDTGSASYTGDLSDNLTARGWVRIDNPDLSDARPGDILLNDGNHVAVVVDGYGWDATVAQASIDENGNVAGGQAGDQTGWETNERTMYDYPWDCILRWQGGDEEDDMPSVIDILGYKYKDTEHPMRLRQNGPDTDVYQMIWNASEQLMRTDNAEHNTPKGHDMFGRVNMLQEDMADVKASLKRIEEYLEPKLTCNV